ncbi:Basic secretory family protein [Melia azedarach]|uniref:Basic secretory family protein n=1 Tax=Melia azedarach TaxID=155640 RepID=A0ACC1XZ58_MELAZ|nr:Basic secretory family protein [Melia azedarach]
MTHVWQWIGNNALNIGWLIEGIADFVRLKANYVPEAWAKPGDGERWDKGHSSIAARFLDYRNGLRNGFVAELNKKMRDSYSDKFFVDLLGKSIDQLWNDYKAKFGN